MCSLPASLPSFRSGSYVSRGQLGVTPPHSEIKLVHIEVTTEVGQILRKYSFKKINREFLIMIDLKKHHLPCFMVFIYNFPNFVEVYY